MGNRVMRERLCVYELMETRSSFGIDVGDWRLMFGVDLGRRLPGFG